jgi:hypothetical protein
MTPKRCQSGARRGSEGVRFRHGDHTCDVGRSLAGRADDPEQWGGWWISADVRHFRSLEDVRGSAAVLLWGADEYERRRLQERKERLQG